MAKESMQWRTTEIGGARATQPLRVLRIRHLLWPTIGYNKQLIDACVDDMKKNMSSGSKELIKTIEVGNVSLEATERDIKELFSLSGEIEYVEMQSCIHYLQGFASGKYAVEKAKTSDEKHQLTSKASPKVASFDRQDTRPLLVTK
ncbi:hypothetical protein V6N11_031048 [Hibiscus sabdariffa]|uniref:RRM domain-containing protein n=1 Tax=Hibiscus sabdariffa TaxID=183260 RepID=A0ABR2ACW1_9ROSI